MKKFKCILLVDDDETSNFISEKVLMDLNLSNQVHCMKNGKEALTFIEANAEDVTSTSCPDLILLDMNMPVMNGVEFLEEFYNHKKLEKKYTSETIIYMLTSSENPRDKDEVSKYGVKGYISKPMTHDKLRSIASS